MFLLVIVTLLLVLIGALVLYYRLQFSKLTHLPGPKPIFLFGNAHEFDPGNPLATLHQWHLKFGSVYRSFIFALPIVQISDPKLARQIVADTETFPRGTWPWSNDNQALGGEVMFAIDGPKWDVRRKRMNPHFSASAFRAFAPFITLTTRRALQELDRYANSGKVIDLDNFTMGITFDVISQFVMTCDWNCVAGESEEAITIREGFRAATREIERLAMLPPRKYFPAFLRKEWWSKISKLMALLDTLYQARKRKPGPDDALQTMMNAGMSMKEVRDELIGILFAGHDTTAHTMTWVIYELQKNPSVREAVLQEVADALKCDRSGDVASFSLLESLDSARGLRLTQAVVNEVLRLYPPGSAHPATATRDVMLGSCHIPGGTIVQINQYAMFRSPELWADPEAFKPERFLQPNPIINPDVALADAFMPFFAGPHVCLGKQLALTELYTILPTLLHYFSFSLEPAGLTVLQSAITARPQQPIVMRVTRQRVNSA